MTRRPFAPSRRQRLATAALLLGCSASSFALNTATIVASTLLPDCLEYRVTGICYWLYCTWTGCTVRTSVKVRHYIRMPWYRATRTPARTLGSRCGR